MVLPVIVCSFHAGFCVCLCVNVSRQEEGGTGSTWFTCFQSKWVGDPDYEEGGTLDQHGFVSLTTLFCAFPAGFCVFLCVNAFVCP